MRKSIFCCDRCGYELIVDGTPDCDSTPLCWGRVHLSQRDSEEMHKTSVTFVCAGCFVDIEEFTLTIKPKSKDSNTRTGSNASTESACGGTD